MRVDLKTALRHPHMFKLYVKEWYGRRVCEGYKAGGAGFIAGGIVWLMLNDPEFAASMAPFVKWGMISVPISFALYSIIAIFFPSFLFWITHQRDDVERALTEKKHR
ncbi:MAG: hypothetical protein II336_13965 [Loktanella sp.]|nr:hypothetical protein [Loktanella sp.]